MVAREAARLRPIAGVALIAAAAVLFIRHGFAASAFTAGNG